jgi:hypothetical protein
MGAQTCAEVNELGNEGVIAAFSWTQGYISAMSAFEDSAFNQNALDYFSNPERATALFRDYCRDFPRDNLFGLAFDLYQAFGGTTHIR